MVGRARRQAPPAPPPAHLRDQLPLPPGRGAQVPQRPRAPRAHEPHRGGLAQARAHVAPRRHRVAQGQRRRRASLGPRPDAALPRLCRVPRARPLHQRHQRHHGEALAVPGASPLISTFPPVARARADAALLSSSFPPLFLLLLPSLSTSSSALIGRPRCVAPSPSQCNPALSTLITKALGSEHWVTHLDELEKLHKFAKNEAFKKEWAAAKQVRRRRRRSSRLDDLPKLTRPFPRLLLPSCARRRSTATACATTSRPRPRSRSTARRSSTSRSRCARPSSSSRSLSSDS